MRIFGYTLFEKSRQEDAGKSGHGKSKVRVLRPGQESRPATGLYLRPHLGQDSATAMVPRRNVVFDFDLDRIKQFPTTVLLKNLKAISPEASQALWIFMRICSSPLKFRVTDGKGNENPRGQAYINDLVGRINKEHGGFEALEGMLFQTIYLQGAASLEVVLADNLKDTLDVVAVDPATITFFRDVQENGQIRYIPKQLAIGKAEDAPLNKEGFYYVPLDPEIGDPYGTSPILPMVQVVLFDMQVLSDIQRVTHNQGYPRLQFKIIEEILKANAPREYERDSDKMRDFIDAELDFIENRVKKMHPDDNYFTTDSTEIAETGGSGKGAITARVLQDILKVRLANSLKVMSIFLNMHVGKTETYGTVEWRIGVESFEGIRRVEKSAVDAALTFALNIRGIQGKVERIHEELPLENREQTEKAEKAKTERLLMSKNAGIIDDDYVAKELYGLEKAIPQETNDEGGRTEPPAPPATARREAQGELLDRLRIPPEETGERTQIVEGRQKEYLTVRASKIGTLETAYRRDMMKVFRRLRRQVEAIIEEDLELEETEE